MKVVILNNDFRVYWKGRLIYLKQYLNARKIDFYAIELFGKGSPYAFDTYNNVEKWWSCLLPNKSATEISHKNIQEVLFSKLDAINPDIIIGPSIVFYPGALGMRWAKKNGKKFVMFDDAMAGQVKRSFIVQWIKNLITKQADGFWLPSQNYYEGYAYLSRPGLLFFYGFNCVDNNRFKAEGSNPLNQKTIICVARLVPIKNIDTLIKAWVQIEKSGAGYKLVVVGNGPEHNNLTTLKAALNLKTIEFLGTIANDELAEYYNMADAFILPSLSESWGLVVNEAMAAGLPVLLSNNINAGKTLLKNGINGFTFNPTDINDMAGAILKYIKADIETKKQMAEKSLELINSMSYESMGHQLTEAIVKIGIQKFNKPGLLASLIINRWNGRYNTAGWDKQ